MKNIPADIVYDRIMDAAKVEQDVDLAAFLGISAQAVGAAKKKKVIPKTWWPIIEEKTGRTREELTRPLEPIEAGVRLSVAEPAQATSEPGYHPDQDKRREWLDLCAKNLEVVFDFIADSYGQDAIGIQNFLDDLRDVHHTYRVWRHEQRVLRADEEKKQAGGGGG